MATELRFASLGYGIPRRNQDPRQLRILAHTPSGQTREIPLTYPELVRLIRQAVQALPAEIPEPAEVS